MSREKEKVRDMQRKLGDEKERYIDVLETFTDSLDEWKLSNDVRPSDISEASSRVAGFHDQAEQMLSTMQNMEELLTEHEMTLEEKEDILAFHELRFTEEDRVKETMLKYIVQLAKSLQEKGVSLPSDLIGKEYFVEAMNAEYAAHQPAKPFPRSRLRMRG
eukprot:scaffold834_cov244-Pinguiococcus_pyrenoidosus.AAC.17